MLSSAQSLRHIRGLPTGFIAASTAYRRATDLSYIQTGFVPDVLTAPAFLSETDLINREVAVRGVISDDDMVHTDIHSDNESEDINHVGHLAEDLMAGGHQQSARITENARVLDAVTQRPLILKRAGDLSDYESEYSSENTEEGMEIDGHSDDGHSDDGHSDDDPFGWSLANDELVDDGRGLSAEELLGEDFEREATDNESRLTEEDLHILRAFQYKHAYFLSQSAFQALPFVFPQIRIPSVDRIRSRVQFLSGLAPVAYDCCVNSCCCFLGSYQNDKCCRYCEEPRYAADGKTARKKYRYTPIIPRLRGMYENKSLCKELLYRHEYKSPQNPNTDDQSRLPDDDTAFTDIWDGKVYRNLKNRYIKIDGEESQTKYFSDEHDVALGLTTDGFCPWRRRKYSAWPILLIIYNLPPEKRNHTSNIIPVSIIPGPKKPKDVDSFLYPLIEELMQLANGVRAFDANTGQLFCLRAFLILAFGDIPAVSLIMKMKGHNGISPCRCCNIHGLRIPGADKKKNKMHYIPLDRSSHPEPGLILKYDPYHLPMRTQEEFLSNAESVITARTRAEEEMLAKKSGIKGKTILTALDSLSFPHSFPYDFMHLIYENLIKNLILLWTNDYKGLGTGIGNYAFHKDVWEAIGAATAEACNTIPSAYSARFASISGDRSTFTADNFSFWALYVGPVLLQRKFTQQRYYDHFVQLVGLLHICLKYEYTGGDLKTIRDGFINWVVTYERLYYQYSPARLSTCPLSIHALLHIADGIEACGPVWAYWAFPMERYCGILQRAVLHSRRHPYVTLDKFIAEDAMLSQLKMRYNLYSELSLQQQKSEGKGYQVPAYPTCVLLPPYSIAPLPAVERDRISAALATRYDVQKSVAKRHVPHQIGQWGKISRFGGDIMKAELLGKHSVDRRDATHIRYQTLVDINARNRNQLVRLTTATFYGQLLRIFCFTVAASPALQLQVPETIIFVEIQPCNIVSRHSSLDIQYYKSYGTPLIFDVTCVQCLVGRVKLDSGGGASEWAIIDRSGSLDQAYYAGDGLAGESAQMG